MGKSEKKIHIIGAGLSGLVAAIVLERFGYHPIIIERDNHIGGRLQTKKVKGYQVDVGFQVLLEAYPKLQEYAKLDQLQLKSFEPGASIYLNSKWEVLGDFTRSPRLFFRTLSSSVGNFKDKLKVFSLSQSLKKKNIEEIFNSPDSKTIDYLRDYGFSEAIIDSFFMPFFGGIFLEDELKTSSRMFEFIYKMFTEGKVSIPKNGISTLPKHLAGQLKNTEIILNTSVKEVKSDTILLENNKTIKTDYTIIATEASDLIPNLKNQKTSWHSCDNLYFLTAEKKVGANFIGLLPQKDALINNIVFIDERKARQEGRYLLSVTVIKKHNLNQEELIKRIKKELKSYVGIQELEFLTHFYILKALPIVQPVEYDIMPSETLLKDGIFLAGDQMLNASVNAAMLSGERAAMGIIELENLNH